MVEQVAYALKNLRCGVMLSEYLLQKQIAEHLARAGIAFEKERKLGKGMRVDFLTASGIAIEVKKGKPNRAQLLSQVNRYANCEEVQAVVIVVETSLSRPILQADNGKPCKMIRLARQWGVAL